MRERHIPAPGRPPPECPWPCPLQKPQPECCHPPLRQQHGSRLGVARCHRWCGCPPGIRCCRTAQQRLQPAASAACCCPRLEALVLAGESEVPQCRVHQPELRQTELLRCRLPQQGLLMIWSPLRGAERKQPVPVQCRWWQQSWQCYPRCWRLAMRPAAPALCWRRCVQKHGAQLHKPSA